MQAADVFVLASYSEGMPNTVNKLYEAAMAGVPVIASRFPEMEMIFTRYP